MDTTQTINNIDKYTEATRRIKGFNYAMQLHKLYNIDDIGLIDMIRQDDKFKKFARKLPKKYYTIPNNDLEAIIEDVLVDIARNRESIVVNYQQMISYTTKSIENRCKDYMRREHSQKRGYDKEGNNLVSSFEAHRNDLGELPFEDKKSLDEYEEVEWMMAITQELKRVKTTKSRTRVATEYMLLIGQGNITTDKEACKLIGCDASTLKEAKILLQKTAINILSEL